MDTCKEQFDEFRKDIKGGNKKKLIHNLQQKKKKCELLPKEEIKEWKRYNKDLIEKMKKINLKDEKFSKKFVRVVRSIIQGNNIKQDIDKEVIQLCELIGLKVKGDPVKFLYKKLDSF